MPLNPTVTAKADPGLFGLAKTNRNFRKIESWGKNQFNSSFPAALACYMGSKNLKPVYLTLNKDFSLDKGYISVQEVLGLKELSQELYFAFETEYTPFATMLVGSLPRVDLVTGDVSNGTMKPLRGIEIKLTAVPDNSTAECNEDRYSAEIVIRPDTIVYLAISIARAYQKERKALLELLKPCCGPIKQWDDPAEIADAIPKFAACLDEVLKAKLASQCPLMMQPIWKTKGKQTILADNAFDMFIWSDFAVTRLFIDVAKGKCVTISRLTRTVVWVTKMLYDFATEGRFDHEQTIDKLTYNTKNDKAFSVPGIRTYPYLKTPELLKPRVRKEAVKDIILGGGEKFLSPERRLDAAIIGTPGLF